MNIKYICIAGATTLLMGISSNTLAAMMVGTMQLDVTSFSKVLDPTNSFYIDNPFATDIWSIGDTIEVKFTFDDESTVMHTYNTGIDGVWDTADDVTNTYNSPDPSLFVSDAVYEFDANTSQFFSRGDAISSERANVRESVNATPELNYTSRYSGYLSYSSLSEHALFKIYDYSYHPQTTQYVVYADLKSYSVVPGLANVPVPPAMILFATGLLGLAGYGFRRK